MITLAEVWHKTISKASNGKVELTPDSLALTIGAFATSLNLKQKPTIIANDTAGALTQILISKQPDIPSRVVLISCDAFKNFPPGAFWMLKYAAVIPGFTWMLQKVVSSPTLRKSPLFLGWLAKKPVPDEIVKAWTKPLLTDVGVQRDIISVCKNLSNKYVDFQFFYAI
jgi:pimeloyl-ACP methyl ester carboxylesterase